MQVAAALRGIIGLYFRNHGRAWQLRGAGKLSSTQSIDRNRLDPPFQFLVG
jgi:hypothetical protein